MNENHNPKWVEPYDTADLIEALTMVAVAYGTWRDDNFENNRQPGGPATLHPVGGDLYFQMPGFLPEPRISFMGKATSISRVAALAIGIDRPMTPLLKFVHDQLVSRDGEETPATVSEFAEALVDFIALENEERGTQRKSGRALGERARVPVGDPLKDFPPEAHAVMQPLLLQAASYGRTAAENLIATVPAPWSDGAAEQVAEKMAAALIDTLAGAAADDDPLVVKRLGEAASRQFRISFNDRLDEFERSGGAHQPEEATH